MKSYTSASRWSWMTIAGSCALLAGMVAGGACGSDSLAIGDAGGPTAADANLVDAAVGTDAAVDLVADTGVDASNADTGTADSAAGPDVAGDGASDAAAEGDALPADAAGPAGPPVVKAIFAGYSSTCALFASGGVKCWGDNTHGQLGLGDKLGRGDRRATMGEKLPYLDLGRGARVVTLSLGAAHACALLEGGAVKCWGDNGYGQLGAGPPNDIGDDRSEMGDQLPAVVFPDGRRAISIAAGPQHACAVLEGGQVSCWGRNHIGQAGRGTSWDPYPASQGPLLPFVDLGSGRTAIAISAGGTFGRPGNLFYDSSYSCALLDNGQVKCWGGYGLYGSLGEEGGLPSRGTKPGQMGDAMPAVPLGGHAAKLLTMGAGHGCALLDTHQIKCWGNSHSDQIGSKGVWGTAEDPHVSVDLGPGRSAIVVSVTGVSDFLDEAHSCAVLDNGQAKCWGPNWNGQLGTGDDRGQSTLDWPPIDVGTARSVRALAAGGKHTCALLDDGQVKCWGGNRWGQLGLEDTLPRGKQGDMGDKLPAAALW
jgi:E3 ubiquitin-protein ligase HERC3